MLQETHAKHLSQRNPKITAVSLPHGRAPRAKPGAAWLRIRLFGEQQKHPVLDFFLIEQILRIPITNSTSLKFDRGIKNTLIINIKV